MFMLRFAVNLYEIYSFLEVEDFLFPYGVVLKYILFQTCN